MLIPLLMDVLHLVAEMPNLPDSFSTAIITVMHSKNKDPLQCSTYRPISLLNADYKSISKVMANRLGQYLPNLIQHRSNRIWKRSSTNRLCRLFNVIHMASVGSDPSIAVSLDAEKAFERLEWPYLFKIRAKFNFRPWVWRMG